MKNLVSILSRMTLFAALVVGLLAGSAVRLTFARQKAAPKQAAATSETAQGKQADTPAAGEQSKQASKHHKKHHKGKKGEPQPSETTNPTQ